LDIREGKQIMKKCWRVNFEGSEIRVENTAFHGRLFVKGELQDHAAGLASQSVLWGRVPTAGGGVATVKVRLGGSVTITCDIFVDDHAIMLSGKEVR